jgi:toxin FitB
MNLVDSSGWLEYFVGSRNAENFCKPLNDLTNLIVPTICIYEVFKVILRESGEDNALVTIAVMKQANVIDLSLEIAIKAAKNSHDFKIPMADSIILTTANFNQAVIWTQDNHFKDLPNVKYFPKH